MSSASPPDARKTRSGTTAIPFVDAHHHFWDTTRNYYPRLCDEPLGSFRYGSYYNHPRKYLPQDYLADTARQNVIKTVHVEAEWNPRDPVGETKWLEAIHSDHGLPTAIIGAAWLDREDVRDVLAGHAASPLVRGVRQKPKAAASPADAKRGAPGSMDDARWRDGFALLEGFGFSYDLQTPYWHLAAAADLAQDFPRTQVILNHTGLPADRTEDGLRQWRSAMGILADQPNAAVKISGIGLLEKRWSIDDNAGIVRDTIAVFGVERCLFASNFPVDGLIADSYDTIIDGFRSIVRDLPEFDQHRLFHGNAERLYRI